MVVGLIGIIGVILVLPISSSTRSDLMTLLGIITSAAIALSSTTFVGNAMAGFLLRIVRNFKSGDFVQVGEYFGRVSEEGIFHTELQTEESNLTTLPNLYLVTQPVTVIRQSGTIISATVSLGYDVPHPVVERVLKAAAEDAGLKDAYVQVVELGDYSVTYRCAGLLETVKRLLAAKSHLRAKMIDHLHENGVEIVSPAFMNQRRIDPARPVIPCPVSAKASSEPEVAEGPDENVVFDKAERAALLAELRGRVTTLVEETLAHEEALKKVKDDESLETEIKTKIDRNRVYQRYLEQRLKALEEEVRGEDETVM